VIFFHIFGDSRRRVIFDENRFKRKCDFYSFMDHTTIYKKSNFAIWFGVNQAYNRAQIAFQLLHTLLKVL